MNLPEARGPYCTCIPGQSTYTFGTTVPSRISHRELLERDYAIWQEELAMARAESVASKAGAIR